jgi:RNA polymerase sigma-70 factor (ECF subfamily)
LISAEARGAWREIEARLRPYVARRVALHADVDDVVQETFARVHRGLPTLSDSERFGPWIYRVAASAIADHRRARVRHPLLSDRSLPSEAACEERDPAEEFRAGLTRCVALFVARLPSPYREAITLTELEGLTQKEAAAMLGVSLSGVKSRVQRGRARILGMFQECCEISLDGRGRVVDATPREVVGGRCGCGEPLDATGVSREGSPR